LQLGAPMKPLAQDKYDFLWRLFADKKLSPPAKCAAVVLLLQYHNTRTGRCNPSFASIGSAISRSRRHTIVAVQELASQDWLKIKSTLGGSKKNTNQFDFNFGRLDEDPSSCSSDETVTGDEFNTGDQNSTEGCGRGDTNHLRTTPAFGGGGGGVAPDGANPSSRAPDGARDYFEALCTIWQQRTYGLDKPAALKAYLAVLQEGGAAEDILASASRWVAAAKSADKLDKLQALEKWLGQGAWRNPPPVKQQRNGGGGGGGSGGRRKGKTSLFEEACKEGGWVQ
jgi:hypothetical protein